RRQVRVADRVELLAAWARHVADELDRGVLVLRELRDGELPAADGTDGAAGRAVRKHRDAELARHLRAGAGPDPVLVRPVAGERGVTVVERVLGLVLLVRRDGLGCGLADLGAERVEDRPSLGVVDRDLAAVDVMAAARRRDPLERIAGQALVSVALEDEAREVRVRLLFA